MPVLYSLFMIVVSGRLEGVLLRRVRWTTPPTLMGRIPLRPLPAQEFSFVVAKGRRGSFGANNFFLVQRGVGSDIRVLRV